MVIAALKFEARQILNVYLTRHAWVAFTSLVVIGCAFSDNNETPIPIVEPSEVVAAGYEIVDDPLTDSEAVDYPEGAKVGGVFRLVTGDGIVPDPAIGDNQTGGDLYSRWLVSEIYSGLTMINPDQDYDVQPDLAQSFEVDSSGLRYEFLLRQGLKFSDGSAVTASDFKWSWERALNPKTRSPRAIEVLGAIQGAVEVSEGVSSELSGVGAVDDRTLKVTLTQPRSDFVALLTDPVAMVLKRENVKNWGVDWGVAINKFERPVLGSGYDLPVGTGPFKVVEAYYRNGPWILERNEHYWDQQPYLDGIEIITEYSVRGFDYWQAREEAEFIEGNVDMIYGYPKGVELKTFPVIGPPETTFIVFNAIHPPFDDYRFRRALAMSLERSAFDHFASSIYPSHGLIPPGFPGYSEDIELLRYDPDLAKQELSASRYAGEEIRFEPLSDGFLAEEFGAMIEVWSETLGVTATYNPLANSEYTRKVEDGDLQMMGFKIKPAYHDPYAIFKVFNDVFQDGNSSDELATVSDMLREAVTEQDAARRLERYAELEQHLIDRALVIPLRWYTGENRYTFQSWVNDFHWPRYGGSKFKNVWFDDTAPYR